MEVSRRGRRWIYGWLLARARWERWSAATKDKESDHGGGEVAHAVDLASRTVTRTL
jgi:hypothetical protein